MRQHVRVVHLRQRAKMRRNVEIFGVGGQGKRNGYGILEFPYVARPIVSHESFESRVAYSIECAFIPGIFEHATNKNRNVFEAMPKRWQFDADLSDAKVEITTKCASVDGSNKVAACGSNDANVDFAVRGTANALDATFCDGTKEFGLDFDGEFTQFVEKNGAAVSLEKRRETFVDGACEGTSLVAEEGGFGEALGDGSAIDDDEWFFCARAGLMNGLGNDFFAGAGFAGDEDGEIGGGDLGYFFEDGPHAGALGNECAERRDVWNDDFFRSRGLEGDVGFSESELACRKKKDFADAHATGEDAVATAEITDAHAVFGGDKLGMDGADFGVVEDDLALGVAADDDGFGSDLEPIGIGGLDASATNLDLVSGQNGRIDHDVTRRLRVGFPRDAGKANHCGRVAGPRGLVVLADDVVGNGGWIDGSSNERGGFVGLWRDKGMPFWSERAPCFESEACRLEAVFALSMQSTFEEALDGSRPFVAGCLGQTGRRALELHRDEEGCGGAFEGEAAAEGSEGDSADGIDICAFVGAGGATNLFRGHVGEGSEGCVESGEGWFGSVAVASTEFGDTEVENFCAFGSIDLARAFDEDVAGFEVAMDDVGGVRSDESFEDVFDEGPDFGEGEVLLAFEAVSEAFAFEFFEDEQVGVVGRHSDFEESTDVGALDGRGDCGFALETADEVWFDGGASEEDFDGDFATIRVAARSPHLSHAAAA